MTPTAAAPAGLLAFRRRAVSVAAGVLAAGMVVLAVVLETTHVDSTWLDVALLLGAATVHLLAAVTVGRTWQPGGRACLAYLTVITLLISVSLLNASGPESDAFWFLLIPVGLSALTMPRRSHVAITAFGLASYVLMSVLGPGFVLGVAGTRMVSMAVFAGAMAVMTGRLEQALVDADTAQEALGDQLAEVQRLNQRLTELDRAKDDFVSSVSHELRTPLTVILGLTGTLTTHWEALDADQRREIAGRVGANARGLEGIVGTLLDLTRIERGGLQPVPDAVPLRAAVEESLVRLGPLIEDHVVTVDVPADTVVRTDPRLLERVLDNLLANAARHTIPGTAVAVRSRLQASSVRIEVSDDGPGVSPDELARLGEQFYRAGDRTAAGANDGIGLGLALVRDVLAALDSHLEISSEAGHGTTFGFVLPTIAADRAVFGSTGALAVDGPPPVDGSRQLRPEFT